VRAFGLIVLLAACSGGSAAVIANNERESNRQLTGAWDATLSLARPYPLAFNAPPARRICGTIGFVEGRALADDGGNYESNGVYRLDLGRLGLDWLDDSRYPIALARQPMSAKADSAAADSIAIVLNPDSQERILLLGRYDAGEIDGDWTAQSARGTASGSFSLRPHSERGQAGRC
jgi:hypothetical protein